MASKDNYVAGGKYSVTHVEVSYSETIVTPLLIPLHLMGDRHNVEYPTRHKLESHTIEILDLLVITSKVRKMNYSHYVEKQYSTLCIYVLMVNGAYSGPVLSVVQLVLTKGILFKSTEQSMDLRRA